MTIDLCALCDQPREAHTAIRPLQVIHQFVEKRAAPPPARCATCGHEIERHEIEGRYPCYDCGCEGFARTPPTPSAARSDCRGLFADGSRIHGACGCARAEIAALREENARLRNGEILKRQICESLVSQKARADAALARVAALGKLIEDAPHGIGCNWRFGPCDCIKSKAAAQKEG
jgi:predicted RNA-binding Zn-ribbon protein involved in translation (DUF1610 family)